MSAPERCGKRYGSRRQFTCKRLAGHKGQHSRRAKPDEMAILMRKGTGQ